MATAPRVSGARRAELVREGWQRAGVYAGQAGGYAAQAGGHASRAFGRTLTVLIAYPPLVQGVYYILVGLLPLLAPGAYQSLTGHRADAGLEQGLGVSLLVAGSVLCLAAYRRRWPPEVLLLALGSAVGFAALDVLWTLRGASALYLLDAVLEGGFLALWACAWWQARQARQAAPMALTPAGKHVPQA